MKMKKAQDPDFDVMRNPSVSGLTSGEPAGHLLLKVKHMLLKVKSIYHGKLFHD